MTRQETFAVYTTVVLVAFLLIVGIYLAVDETRHENDLHGARHSHILHKTARVHHLKNGQYYFQDGGWYYYYSTSDIGSINRIPAGGAWYRSNIAPQAEEEEGEFDASIAENENGTVIEGEVESQAVGDGTDTNSGAAEPASTPSDSTPDSGSSGDSGGDSGDGGDGGL